MGSYKMKKSLMDGAFSLLAMVLLATVGCKDGSRPADLPDGVECVVSVVQDGQPLANATITFVPQDEANKKYSPGGQTDANGDAEMRTYGYPGVAPGKYKVLVWKDIEDGGKTKTDEKTGEESYVEGKEFRTVDPKFFDESTTTLEIDVAKKMEKVVFDVGKVVRIPKH